MKKNSVFGNVDIKPATGSVRFIISVTGGKLHLIRKQKIAMKAPPADMLPDRSEISGSWIELRQDDGNLLYSRMIHDSFSDFAEIYSEKPGEPMSWHKAQGIERTVVILVPDLPGAAYLVVLNKAAGEKGTPAEKARFSVNE
jgi:hypothetical protein